MTSSLTPSPSNDQPIPFVAEYRAALMRATAAAPRRARRRLALLAAATVLALALPVVGAVVLPRSSASAVAVTREGDQVVIRVVDEAANAVRLERDLRAHGVEVKVVAVPTTPDEVGHWVALTSERDRLTAELRLAASGKVSTLVRLPAGSPLRAFLYVGRAPKSPTEPYVVSGGKVQARFDCFTGRTDLAGVAAEIQALGYRAVWYVLKYPVVVESHTTPGSAASHLPSVTVRFAVMPAAAPVVALARLPEGVVNYVRVESPTSVSLYVFPTAAAKGKLPAPARLVGCRR
jgi:hypothetical protein